MRQNNATLTRVQEINNRLVESIREIQRGLQEEIESLESGFVARQADRADEIVRITQEATDKRATANQTFTETMEGHLHAIWSRHGIPLKKGSQSGKKTAQKNGSRLSGGLLMHGSRQTKEYADRLARISVRTLVDEVRRIESEIVDVQQRHADDAVRYRAGIHRKPCRSERGSYARRLDEIEIGAEERQLEAQARRLEEQTRRLQAIQQAATDARLQADQEYATEFQDIQNDLVDSVVDIQRGLNATLNDLRDEQLDVERDRLTESR